MNAHADIFPQVTAIAKTLPDPIDQMKFFELIQIIPPRPCPHSGQATWSTKGFPTRGSWDICETTACSPLERRTGQEHRQRSAKFSTRCGSSMPNSNERFPNSTRSGSGKGLKRWMRGMGPSPRHQSGPRMAHRGSQNSFTAAVTPLLMMSRRSGESILSSSSRLMIEPASSRTAGIRVFLSTMS